MEGGGRLSRPFGYFGHVIACALAVVACVFVRGEATWLLAGGLATAGPLIQAIGRLRCLVQGCCHGERSESADGIHYHVAASRVCALAGWRGRPVKPTQVWSILNGVLVFGLLWRLWGAGVPTSMIVGLYLVLTGLTRFVEEHFRGEPQTKVWAGLHSYQWLCIAMFAAGAACTCVASPVAIPAGAAPLSAWLVAIGVGVVYAFAMGVDFPASNRRFSLLVPREETGVAAECRETGARAREEARDKGAAGREVEGGTSGHGPVYTGAMTGPTPTTTTTTTDESRA